MLTESKVGEISWRKCAFAIIGAAAEMWRCIQGVIVSVNQHKGSLIFPARSGFLFFDKSINPYHNILSILLNVKPYLSYLCVLACFLGIFSMC